MRCGIMHPPESYTADTAPTHQVYYVPALLGPGGSVEAWLAKHAAVCQKAKKRASDRGKFSGDGGGVSGSVVRRAK